MSENDFIKFYRDVQSDNILKAFPYKNVLNEIVGYIQKKISNNIDKEFENMKISICQDLSIFVEYEYYDDGFLTNKKNLEYIYDFDDVDFVPEIRLTKGGKIENGEISIRCLFDYKSNKLFSLSTYNNLYNEINGLYSIWKEVFQNKKMERILQKAYRTISLYIDEMNDIKETEKSGILKRM